MDTTGSKHTGLAFAPDMFGGVVVESESLPEQAEVFEAALRQSLQTWKSGGVRLVWVAVPLERAALIPIAVAAGFTFHHTNADALMLVARLVEDAFVPLHATHYVGVGGVVINARDELLVVCEKHRRTKQPYYKLPGGALQPGPVTTMAPISSSASGRGSHARGSRGNRRSNQVRSAGLLPPLARLPLRQVGHLLRVSLVAAERRRDDAG